jgi:hypothetical protein
MAFFSTFTGKLLLIIYSQFVIHALTNKHNTMTVKHVMQLQTRLNPKDFLNKTAESCNVIKHSLYHVKDV